MPSSTIRSILRITSRSIVSSGGSTSTRYDMPSGRTIRPSPATDNLSSTTLFEHLSQS